MSVEGLGFISKAVPLPFVLRAKQKEKKDFGVFEIHTRERAHATRDTQHSLKRKTDTTKEGF